MAFGITSHQKCLCGIRFRRFFAMCLVVFCSFERSGWSAEGLQYPLAVTVAPDNVVYVADRDLPGIWKYSGNEWSVFFQGSKKFRTPLNAVRCLAIDHEGNLLAGDSATREVYRFSGSTEPLPLTAGLVGVPAALAVAKDGTIFVSDLETQRIFKIPAAGGKPIEVAHLPATRGLCIDSDGFLIAVCHGDESVIRMSTDGKEKTVLVKGRPFQFSHHVVSGKNGEFYVADGYAKSIWKIEGQSPPVALISGAPLKNPVGLAREGDNLLIADPQLKAILKRGPDGSITELGGPSAK